MQREGERTAADMVSIEVEAEREPMIGKFSVSFLNAWTDN